MTNLLAVKEYDTISGNDAYEHSSYYKFLNPIAFDNLKTFIRESSATADTADALDFMRIGYHRGVGDVISVNSYVGLIETKDGTRIEILPKISFAEGEDPGNKETKRVFLNMLRCLNDNRFKVFGDAGLHADRMNLYEIFINMYLAETRKLIKHGLRSAYVTQQDNLKYYRGKLLTGPNIRMNATHKERFFMAFDEFCPNRPENKLIKSTLLYLSKKTQSAENAKEIRQLLSTFEMVDPSYNYPADFSQVHIDRNSKDYEALMEWSKVYLLRQSFTTFSGESSAKALLFPMEKIFESFVGRNVQKVMGSAGWKVALQDTGYYLFANPKRFALRPDIVLKKDDRTVILDTKWKNLHAGEFNYGISQADMYQMYSYSKKYDSTDIWLLYPLNDEFRNHSDIVYDSGDQDIHTKVHLFFVDIAHIEDSLHSLLLKIY